MVSPPPVTEKDEFGYADYFAIKQWTNIPSTKYIIIVGELGASDGSAGMYKYMLENEIWALKCREKVLFKIDEIFGGTIEKEVFIFDRFRFV